MTQRILTCLFLLAFLVGCAVPGGSDATPVAFGQAPARATSATEENPPAEKEPTNTPPPTVAPPTEVPATVAPPTVAPSTEPPATATTVPEENPENQPPGLAGFSDLYFATSADGAAQSTFLNGTQEIYAIWNYEGMQEGDNMRRVWYLNDQLQIERTPAWDFGKYGASGTVRDVFTYDYIDGIDPGQWRVELYINGQPELVGTFSVQ